MIYSVQAISEIFDSLCNEGGGTTAFIIGMGVMTLGFVVALLLALFAGDFARIRRGARLIAYKDRIREGIKKMGKCAPEFDRSVDFAPSASQFDRASYLDAPYRYSAAKKLGTATATICSVMVVFMLMQGVISIVVSQWAGVLMRVTLCAVYGGILTITAHSVSSALYKGACRDYAKMIEKLKAESAPHTEVTVDGSSAEVAALCEKIETIAMYGGAKLDEFKDLFDEIKRLLSAPDVTPYDEERLNSALDLLNKLVSTLM